MNKASTYGRPKIDQDDIDSVVEVLKTDWLTTGPQVLQFEEAFCQATQAKYAISCANGTAALHLAYLAAGLGPGDWLVTSPNTFLATANAARFCGANVAFADIDPTTGNIDPESLEKVLQQIPSVKVVTAIHYAGRPANLTRLGELAEQYSFALVEDACHALGGTYRESTIGDCRYSTLATFSFHPVKPITSAEGGAVTTNDAEMAARLSSLRNHGMQRDPSQWKNQDLAFTDGEPNPWYYEMDAIGLNYRLTDLQCALGRSQLKKLNTFTQKRNQLAEIYHHELESVEFVHPLDPFHEGRHAYHLFSVQIDFERAGTSRAAVMNQLKSQGIGTQVHYIPLHLQPYYQRLPESRPVPLKQAESFYSRSLSLPLFVGLDQNDVHQVVTELKAALGQ